MNGQLSDNELRTQITQVASRFQIFECVASTMIKFYELIEKIKQRPALYLGKKSISHLQVFLDGYTFACREIGVSSTEQEQDFEEFQDWIEQRFNQQDTQSWSRIILFYSEDESDALNRFFELFEEFLKAKRQSEKLQTIPSNLGTSKK